MATINLLHEENDPKPLPPKHMPQDMPPINKPPSPPQPPSPKTTNRLPSSHPGTSGDRILQSKRTSGPTERPAISDSAFDVNLLSDELVVKFNPRQRAIQLGLVVLGAAVVIGLATGAISFLRSGVDKQIKAARSELSTVKADINRLAPVQKEMTATADKTAAVRVLIEKHVRWTKFFNRLEHYTLPQITYGTTFSGTVDGKLTLSGHAPAFDDVALQYLVFQQAVTQNDFITSFTITGAQRLTGKESTGVSFAVSLTLNPIVFANVISEPEEPETPSVPAQTP